jgi:hypothetical protein
MSKSYDRSLERSGESGEGEQRPLVAGREPRRDLLAVNRVVFAEGRERHQAAIGGRQPALPMRARDVADVGGAAVGSRRISSLKSTGLPLASSFFARFLVAFISAFWDDGMPQRAITSSRPTSPADDRRRVVRKDAGLGGQIAAAIVSDIDPEQAPDRVDVLGHGVEIAHAPRL